MFVRRQDKDTGMWRGLNHVEQEPKIGTSLALLFLSKGRRPVLMGKLQHGGGDDWNHHRGDVANLTTYVETKVEEGFSDRAFLAGGRSQRCDSRRPAASAGAVHQRQRAPAYQRRTGQAAARLS